MSERSIACRSSVLVVTAAIALLGAGCGAQAEADKSADAIVADAQAAMRSVSSYRLTVSGESRAGPETFHLDVAGRGLAAGSLHIGAVSADFVLSAGRFYVRGRDFLASFAGPQVAQAAGDRWVVLPAAAIGPVGLFSDTDTVAECLLGNHGTLTRSGTATVAGRPAVVLADRGDRPATSPGRLYVATTGSAFPLRFDQTGPERPGSPPPGCSATAAAPDDPTAALSGIGTLSDFGAAISVATPSDAVQLPG